MKEKALIKDILKEIWKTKNRFLSILLIVMLGTGFFAGVKSTCPNMKDTAQKYYEDYNLFDFHFQSTMGFTEGDITTLETKYDVKDLYAGYSADLFMSSGGIDCGVAKVYSYNFATGDNPHTINRLRITEGRMAENENECVLDLTAFDDADIKIGDKVSFYTEDGKDIGDYLKVSEFEVVGFAETPMYINFERGKTTLGNGSVECTVYVGEDVWSYDVYTDVFVTYADMQEYPFYTDEYKALAEEKRELLEEVGKKREKTRYDEIYDEALAQIEEAEKELEQGEKDYEDGKTEYETQIAAAEKQLESAKATIDSGKEELSSNSDKINEGWVEYYKAKEELDKSKATLDAAIAEADAAAAEINEMKTLIADIRGVVEKYAETYVPEGEQPDAETQAVLDRISQFDKYAEGISENLKKTLTEYIYKEPGLQKTILKGSLEAILTQTENTLDSQMQVIDITKTTLNDSKAQLDEGYELLDSTRLTLEDGQRQITEGQKELADAEAEYEAGLIELEENRVSGKQELDDAAAQIEDAKAEILSARHDLNEMGEPEWYIFDRTDSPGYSEFSDDAERVDRIAKVFPVFFIIVAALVCLTTMTRMVEEQRVQIGTLKSLGYGKGAAVAKYLIYAVSASLIGSVLGLVLGFNVLPRVIFEAYRIMYVMPDIVIVMRWDYVLLCIGVSVAVTGIAAYSACSVELREQPAQLLRPKPPKIGKRILLERVGFVWKRLSFLHKVSARNIFRYKKRIYMTVIGVAGCTALMMAGFGLKYSIESIVDRQYEDIFHYDALAVTKDGMTALETEELSSQTRENEYVESSLYVCQENMTFKNESKKYDAYMFIPESTDTIGEYITIRDRKSGETIELTDDGIVITEKLSKLLDAEAGDTIEMTLDSGDTAKLHIDGVTENYVMNYVYMTGKYYEKISGEAAGTNGFIMNLTDDYDSDELSTEFLKNNNVLAVTYSREGGDQFREIVGSLNYIVLVIIICAGALAFVVLYNLANINIEERIREIATIKVLGFYDREVSSYIHRESVVSALMGMLAGLALGVPFLKFIIKTAEVDAVMFNPQMQPSSFIYAGALTMLFTLVVNWAMHFRLKKVDMVSSLKSVE